MSAREFLINKSLINFIVHDIRDERKRVSKPFNILKINVKWYNEIMSRTILLTGGTEKEREEIAIGFFKKKLPHPDFIVIEPEISIGIKEIRDLEHQVSLKPYSETEKVILIKNAEKLTTEAQNAFLKTLEEPPDHSVIILSVLTSDSLIPTIISRCEVIRVSKNSGDKKEINGEQNILEYWNLFKLSIGKMFEYCAKSFSNREETIEWLNTIIHLLHQNLVYPNIPISSQECIYAQEALNEAKKRILSNVAPRFVMENLFLKINRFLT